MSILQALAYFVREAIANLVRGWRISSLAVITTALSLFIGGMLILAAGNMTAAVERWRSAAQVVVYLDEDLERVDIDRVAESLRAALGVEDIVEIGSEQARERFRASFPDLEEVLSEFDPSPFPVSFEMQLGAGGVGGEWLARIGEIPGVAEVDSDARWLETLRAAAAVAKALGLLLGGILMAAAAVSIASVVRLSTFVYRKEIAAMRLIGATEFFVRGPFVVEGLVQGLAGSCVALLGLWLGYWGLGAVALPWFVREALLGSFLSLWQVGALLALGAVAGLFGAIVPLREQSGVFG